MWMAVTPTRAVLPALVAIALAATAVVAWPTSDVSARGAAQTEPPAAVLLDGDFDGDGRTDIFWYGPGSNPDHHWYGRSNMQFGGKAASVQRNYEPITGDFDGDGRTDIFWYGPGSASDVLWYGTSAHGFAGKAVSVGGTYRPFTGDFNGDGRVDIFWYAPGSAGDVVWYGTASRGFAGRSVTVTRTYEPLVGDYDGDRRSDIFWYAPGSAGDVVWYGTATRSFAGRSVTVTRTYEPLVGDYDGDHRTDIFWYAPGSAGDAIWYGAAGRSFAGKSVTVTRSYQPVVGDFNGGGLTDVFWYAPGTADDRVWFANATRSFVTRHTTIDLAYELPQPLQPQSLRDAYVPFGYIAHAAGAYDGRTYTNSLDAFLFNYDRGFRIFEIDFVVLADGTVLAAHTGLEHYYGLDKPFTEATWAEVQGRKFDGKYTIMRSQDVVQLLRDHPDVFVILDTKYQHHDIFKAFAAQTGGGHELMDRVLPHIKDQAELDQYRTTWPLRNYVIALYRTQFSNTFDDPEVIRFVRDNRSPAVMMWWNDRDFSLTLSQNHVQARRFTPEFAAQLQTANAVAAVHSIRDPALVPRFESLHVGIYSDGPFAVGTQRQAQPEPEPVDPIFAPGVVPA
jgi:hypothetical protein